MTKEIERCPKCDYELLGVYKEYRGVYYDCSNPHCGYWEEEVNNGGETIRPKDEV